MFTESARLRDRVCLPNLVIAAGTLVLGTSAAAPEWIDGFGVSVATLVLLLILLMGRLTSWSAGSEVEGIVDWAVLMTTLLALHHLVAFGVDGGAATTMGFASALALALAAATGVVTGMKLILPLRDRERTRTIGMVIAVSMCLAVAGILVSSLHGPQVGALNSSASRAASLMAVSLGLAVWAAAFGTLHLRGGTGRSDDRVLIVHLVGFLHLALSLSTHLLELPRMIPEGPLVLIALVALACRDSGADGSSPISRPRQRRREVIAVTVTTVTLLVPGILWMHFLGRELAWYPALLMALCIGLGGGLIGILRYRASEPVWPPIPENRDLALHFQPIVRTSDACVIGAEALLRRSLAGGSCESLPDVVECLGRSIEFDEVTDFVLTETFREGSSLLAAMHDPDAFVSFNLSPDEVIRPNIVERIERALTLAGCDPHGFGIELTEQATLGGSTEQLGRSLALLQDMGFLIILDDFGTGQSNLVSLCDFEFDIVKIDQSLVHASDTPRGDRLLHRTIELAEGTGARVVVEGIEEPSHLDALRRHRPDFAQGYAYSDARPMLDVLDQLQTA